MNWLKKILAYGTYPGQDSFDKATAIFINKAAFATIPLLLGYMTYYLSSGQNKFFLISHAIYITTSFLVLYFHSKNDFNTTHWVLAIGYTLAFVGTSIMIGEQSQVIYFLLVSGIGVGLLFKKKRTRLIFFLFNLLALISVQIYFYYQPEGLLGLFFPKVFNIINATLIFSLVYVIIENTIHTRAEYQSALLQRNKEITLLNASLEEKVKERTAEIAAKNDALARSNEELRRFAYISSHDLKEPLRNVMGFVQLIERDVKKQRYENLNEYAQYATWGVKRLDRLINDIAIYTEIETKIETKEKVNLHELLARDIVSNLEAFTKKTNAIISLEPMPTIHANAQLMTILFLNLFENALTYCDKPQPKIQISYEEKNSFYTFKIEDNGIGIPEKFQKEIFTMFRRLDNNQQQEGSGIGLSIAQKIVEGYGGQIWVTSTPKIGSCFYFTFPC